MHSVLKQQKTKESSQVAMETEQQEKDQREKVVKQLQAKLKQTRYTK